MRLNNCETIMNIKKKFIYKKQVFEFSHYYNEKINVSLILKQRKNKISNF